MAKGLVFPSERRLLGAAGMRAIMATISYTGGRGGKWMLHIARALALVWACWWAFFGLASGLSEGLAPLAVLIHAAMPGLVFLISASVAWRWQRPGGVLLAVEGIVVLIGYPARTYGRFPPSTIVFVCLTMGLPPLAAGGLLLANWRRMHTVTGR